jgi:trehalose 6-phosphate phosphatase
MSGSVFKHLDELKLQLTAAPAVLLCFDFDGTLTPIVDSPHLAELQAPVRRLLLQLARRENVTLAIISGRSLDDLRQRVGIPDWIYAGNHGLEISGPGLTFVEPSAAACRETLHQLADNLVSRLQSVAGVHVEDKGLTVSVHYRQVAAEDGEEVRRQVHAALSCSSHPFVLGTGHMVYEIRPRVYWNKGDAIHWIAEQRGLAPALPLYMGDDATDEDAFAALTDGITIKVGDSAETAARYHVDNQTEVQEFLAWLTRLSCLEAMTVL